MRLYNDPRWRVLRERTLARDNYTCQLCGRLCTGVGNTLDAPVVDHIVPHRGDPGRFFDPGNLQTLCKECHDRYKQRWERLGLPQIGVDGWPVASADG